MTSFNGESSRIIQDDRDEKEIVTHTRGVIARDTFLSGWGKAKGKTSYAVWAYDPNVLRGAAILSNIKDRDEMRNVNIVELTTPKGKDTYSHLPPRGHIHIYVMNPGHPHANGCVK